LGGELAAEAGVLYAAPRHAHGGGGTLFDPDEGRGEGRGDGGGAGEVGGPDAGGEAVAGGVGAGDGVVHVVEALDHGDRAEDLLGGGAGRGALVAEHGRRVEEGARELTAEVKALPAERQRGALAARPVDAAGDAVAVRGRDQRAELGGGIER